MTDVVLTPAACYPVYPSFTGTIPAQGHLVDMQNWVFRHEPSPEPTRMQAFRVREFVRVGTPEVVVEWRDMWLGRGVELLQSLGLPAKSDVASDPFFGRGGRMLAGTQREQKLKFEVLVPVISEEKPTAVCSFNYHQDHFGKIFDIKTPTGDLAQTACLGFGLERCVMALFKTHGMVPAAWPTAVAREALAGSRWRLRLRRLDPPTYVPARAAPRGARLDESRTATSTSGSRCSTPRPRSVRVPAVRPRVDFDGDQWTFFKPSHDDLTTLYGIDVQELNVWRPLVENAREQLGGGKLVLSEADAFFLPDTAGTDYRTQHTKTTIGIQELDLEAERSATSTTAATTRCAAPTSSASSGSTRRPTRRTCRSSPSSCARPGCEPSSP